MTQFTRTWWGKRFLTALEQFTDASRLARGRSYATNGRIIESKIVAGSVQARVRGSINPYFGVTKEPIYKTSITITQISDAHWSSLVARMAARADFVTRLLLNEMPDTIEEAFTALDLHLLPVSRNDFKTSCSCPDDYNPCKHISGVYYLLASRLDTDPFLIFELRGLSRADLHSELAKSPLGQVLASAMTTEKPAIQPATSQFTRPQPDTTPIAGHKAFWSGSQPLPTMPPNDSYVNVPALLIKKQGDYPPFWHKDASFITVMEELYERVRSKNPNMK